jgi:chemotaxis family two-component system response regulator Rcp1
MVDSSNQQKDVLLVDDNPADVTLLQHAVLQYGKLAWRIYRVIDGEAALAFLRQEGMFAGMPHPNLIILDIGLPKCDGWEVLKILRATPTLATIPVVMLTGVTTQQDEKQMEVLRPRACFEKPMKLEEYPQLIAQLEQLLD